VKTNEIHPNITYNLYYNYPGAQQSHGLACWIVELEVRG